MRPNSLHCLLLTLSLIGITLIILSTSTLSSSTFVLNSIKQDTVLMTSTLLVLPTKTSNSTLSESNTVSTPTQPVTKKKEYLGLQKILDYKMINRTDNIQRVLFYTMEWGWKNWGMSSDLIDKNSPELKNCPSSNCIFAHNRNYLKEIHEYDAVVFHQSESCWYNRSEFEPIKTRSPHQLYIVAAQETPANIKVEYYTFSHIFNLTMTYRLDSDIKWFYGKVFEIASGEIVAPALNVKWRQPDEDFQDDIIEQLVRNKTKTAAWLVSMCKRPSGRDEFVKKLQTMIDVDVYGSCGTLKCDPYPFNCFDYNTTYKFYFAFENSLCVDYITEKTFKVMNSYIIPVIYSGADISRFIPPKSYIDANAFDTAEDLANHLKFLSDNPKEYVKYFWWKKHYRAELWSFDVCEICKKLNEPDLLVKSHEYPNIDDWFNNDVCKNATIKF